MSKPQEPKVTLATSIHDQKSQEGRGTSHYVLFCHLKSSYTSAQPENAFFLASSLILTFLQLCTRSFLFFLL